MGAVWFTGILKTLSTCASLRIVLFTRVLNEGGRYVLIAPRLRAIRFTRTPKHWGLLLFAVAWFESCVVYEGSQTFLPGYPSFCGGFFFSNLRDNSNSHIILATCFGEPPH